MKTRRRPRRRQVAATRKQFPLFCFSFLAWLREAQEELFSMKARKTISTLVPTRSHSQLFKYFFSFLHFCCLSAVCVNIYFVQVCCRKWTPRTLIHNYAVPWSPSAAFYLYGRLAGEHYYSSAVAAAAAMMMTVRLYLLTAVGGPQAGTTKRQQLQWTALCLDCSRCFPSFGDSSSSVSTTPCCTTLSKWVQCSSAVVRSCCSSSGEFFCGNLIQCGQRRWQDSLAFTT